MLAALEVAIMVGRAQTALELRGVTLRMPLDRKNVDGCARAARRSSEVDDIRKDDRGEVFLRIFRSSSAMSYDFR